MEYGQIFHVMRIGKYYCKNMRYRINSNILNMRIYSMKLKIRVHALGYYFV